MPMAMENGKQSVALEKKRFDKRNKKLPSVRMRNFLLDKFLKDKAPMRSPQFKENLINSLEKLSYYSIKQFCQRVLEIALIASEDMCGTLVINESHFIEAAKFYFIRLNIDGMSDQRQQIPPQAAPKNKSGRCLLF